MYDFQASVYISYIWFYLSSTCHFSILIKLVIFQSRFDPWTRRHILNQPPYSWCPREPVQSTIIKIHEPETITRLALLITRSRNRVTRGSFLFINSLHQPVSLPILLKPVYVPPAGKEQRLKEYIERIYWKREKRKKERNEEERREREGREKLKEYETKERKEGTVRDRKSTALTRGGGFAYREGKKSKLKRRKSLAVL